MNTFQSHHGQKRIISASKGRVKGRFKNRDVEHLLEIIDHYKEKMITY